jgi:hypothetical protein
MTTPSNTHASLAATMATPDSADAEDAIVVLVYWARAYLDDIARSIAAEVDLSKSLAESAAGYLDSALFLMRETSGDPKRTGNILANPSSATLAIERAREAARAVVHNIAVFSTYSSGEQREARISGKSAVNYHTDIMRKSARYANQEAHRAMMALSELFPESFRTEE